ncbi:MAG TPA: hypothetical protein VG944_15330 [Fimbriimonas sp.]|nr:hypothetical protein [Fimbriimonas sp.]
MAVDLHLSIPEDSAAAKVVMRMAESEHISADQAAVQLLSEAAKLRGQKSPGEQMWGAFPDEEDEKMLDDIVAEAYVLRLSDQVRDLDS